jgi:hypothetical protein
VYESEADWCPPKKEIRSATIADNIDFILVLSHTIANCLEDMGIRSMPAERKDPPAKEGLDSHWWEQAA